jgi:hypothetical protein
MNVELVASQEVFEQHADSSTTKLYDQRGYNPEKSASFFANY